MDVIRDSIENRADDVCRAKEELRTTPIYPHSAAYACEHGELAAVPSLHISANSANARKPIEADGAARTMRRESCLGHGGGGQRVCWKRIGTERVSSVFCANTVQRQEL